MYVFPTMTSRLLLTLKKDQVIEYHTCFMMIAREVRIQNGVNQIYWNVNADNAVIIHYLIRRVN